MRIRQIPYCSCKDVWKIAFLFPDVFGFFHYEMVREEGLNGGSIQSCVTEINNKNLELHIWYAYEDIWQKMTTVTHVFPFQGR